MRLETYQCLVSIATYGGWQSQWVQVQAANYPAARIQLEALYGRDSLISSPQVVR